VTLQFDSGGAATGTGVPRPRLTRYSASQSLICTRVCGARSDANLCAQGSDFLPKSQRIDHHSIADDAGALGPQNAAGHQLQINFLPLMMTVCPALWPPV